MRGLRFPQLCVVDYQVTPKFPSRGTPENLALYRLDWEGFEKLPDFYEERIQNLQFAIPTDYKVEIINAQTQAQATWARYYPFDTCIRDMCLEPAIAYARVATYLIWDCVYDEKTQAYTIGKDWWLKHAMLYKQWMRQTGGLCVGRNAEIPELERRIDRFKQRISESPKNATLPRQYDLPEVVKFVETIRKMEKEKFKLPEKYISPFDGETK